MRIALDEQLRALGASVLLGFSCSLLYDLLRAIRMPRRTHAGFTAFWDGIYCLALAVVVFFFSLRIGDGELRLYMLLAALAAATLFFALLSPLLRPLWDFWAQTLFALLRLALLPMRKTKIFYGKLAKFCKRLFLFSKQSAIISSNKQFSSPFTGGHRRKEGRPHGKGERKKTRRFFRNRVHSGPADARGSAVGEYAREDFPGRE